MYWVDSYDLQLLFILNKLWIYIFALWLAFKKTFTEFIPPENFRNLMDNFKYFPQQHTEIERGNEFDKILVYFWEWKAHETDENA